MSRTTVGMAAIYNGGLQQGLGVGRTLKKIESGVNKVGQFAKRNNLVSAVGKAADIAGVTGAIDGVTRGAFSRAVDYGKSKGYGKRHKRKKGGCKKCKK